MSRLHPEDGPRALLAVTAAVALGASGCQSPAGPAFVGVLSLAVTTQSGPTTIAGNVPTPCELDVDFGRVPIGVESAGTIEIVNHDSTAVSFSSFGADLDSEFGLTIAVFQLPSIEPDASASFPVTFQPARIGAATSSFSIPTNLPAGSCGSSGAVVIKLTGTGIAAGSLVVTPKSLDFGNVLVSSTSRKTVTLSNASATVVSSITCVVSGSDANLFTVSGCPSALAGNAAASLSLTFAPVAAAEARSLAVVTFAGGNSPAAILNLAGESLGGALSLAPSVVDFGYVPQMTTEIVCSTATNQADVSVDITGVSNFVTGGGAFGLATTDDATPPNPVSFPISIGAGQAAKVCFAFAPAAMENYVGQLTLNTTDPTGTAPMISLDGWGGGPQISCKPTSVAFDDTLENSGSTFPVICTNTGTPTWASLTIDPTAMMAPIFTAQFDETIDPYPQGGLAPGQSVQIDVTYLPATSSGDQGTLSIKNNGGQGEPIAIPLTGQGVNVAPCQFVILPAQLDFGNEQRGDFPLPLAFAVENTGTDICLVRAPSIQNDPSNSFRILSTSLQPNPQTHQITIPAPGPSVTSSLTVSVAFSPPGSGSFSGEVAFGISDPSNPDQVVPLEGSSAATCLTVLPGALQFGNLGMNSFGDVCGSASRSFTVFNTCTSNATVQSFAIQSGAGEGVPQFSLPAGPIPPATIVARSDGFPYTMSFDPTTAGSHSAQLLVSDGMVDTLVSLAGTAVASETVTDSFVVGLPQVDVLFVMDVADDTASQTDLVSAAPGFVQAASGIDYRMAVTTDNDDASIATAELGRLLPCSGCSLSGGTPTIISPASVPSGGTGADPATALADLCKAVPTDGFPAGFPQGDHFFRALYNALQNDPAPGLDFFRPGATFAVITVNDDDSDDNSQNAAGNLSTGWYQELFQAYFMNQPGFSWNYLSSTTIVTGTGFIDPSQLPTNIGEMLSGTGGIAVNASDASWQSALDSFWEGILESSGDYQLSSTPSQGQSSISVAVDGVTIKQLAAPGDPNWTYRSDLNAIRFTASYTPKSGDTIAVTYQVCNP